jgi:Amt family ammonium transporter
MHGVDEAVMLDVEQRRDSRRLDEAAHARGDAGTRRDPLLGQHHRRLEGMLWAGGYAFVCTLILGLLIDKTIGFTVGKEVESHGLDIAEHGESAYHLP